MVAQADILSGEGLEEAVDIRGAEHLSKPGEKAGVEHLQYVSIVGVDCIPFVSYEHKYASLLMIDLLVSMLRTTCRLSEPV